MGKQAFDRRKDTLAILVVFLVIISMTSTVVIAADKYREHHSGGSHHGYGSSGYPKALPPTLKYYHGRYDATRAYDHGR